MTSSCLATIPAKKMVTPIDLVTLDLNLAFRPRLRQIEVLGYFRKRKFTPSPLFEVVGKKPGLCHGARLWVSVTRVYFATRKVTGAIRILSKI